MKRYLQTWLLFTVVFLTLVGVFNVLVDPYRLFGIVDVSGLNSKKPAAGAHGATVKPYQVVAFQPNGLILGNSRAEVGIDPEYLAWPSEARPVFNLALPGTGTSTSLRSLKLVLEAADSHKSNVPKVVVWGLDFIDFLVDENATDTQRQRIPQSAMRRVRDYAESTLTLSATLDSLQTLSSQRNPFAIDITRSGHNPMRDYIKIAKEEGYWNIFQQKDIVNIKAMSKRSKSIFNPGTASSQQFEDLREIIRLCRQHGIELYLFTYPYHAHLLVIFQISGHWPLLADWKRELVRLLEGEALLSGKPAIPLFDFIEINNITTENIPAKSDKISEVKWYWEAGHFKSQLGNKILEQIFNKSSEQKSDNKLFSVNSEAKIEALNNDLHKYFESHSIEIEQLKKFKPTK